MEFTLDVLEDAADDNGETIVLNASSTNPAFTAPTRTVAVVDTNPPATVMPQNVAAAAGPAVADGDLGGAGGGGGGRLQRAGGNTGSPARGPPGPAPG